MFDTCQYRCQEAKLFEFQHDFGNSCSTTFSVTKSKPDFVKDFALFFTSCFAS